MAILITGGSGFVGMAVTERLLSQGEAVVILSSRPAPEPVLKALRAHRVPFIPVVGDVRCHEDLERAWAAAPIDRIVHAAAITPGAAREALDGPTALEVNTVGTLRVLEVARARGARRVVLLSSAAVYGASAFQGDWLDEEAAVPRPESVYAITKYAAERLALRLSRLWRIDLVALRLGSVFGPWERDTGVRETLSPIWHVTRCAISGQAVTLPRPGRRDWIYVRDVAEVVARAMDLPAAEPLVMNIGLGREWTVADWCERLALRFPHFCWRIGTVADGGRIIDYHGERDRAPLAIKRLRKCLGFTPRFGIDEAFADYMAWLCAYPDVTAAQ